VSHEPAPAPRARERADAVDALIVANLSKVANTADNGDKGWALAAVGGYGRRRLAPYSDVDLALLHTGLKPDRVKTLTQQLFYPLWDAQLKVSHTVRTIREAVSAASDIHWLTSGLDARFLGGDRDIFDVFVTKMRVAAGARGARPFIKTITSAAAARRRRFGHAGRLLEANVKEGRGGLRDIQTVSWIVKALGASGVEAPLAQADKETLAGAEEFLWQVRVGLQEISGKGSDTLLNEHRGELVDRMFPGQAGADAHFNRRFYSCTRAVAHISDAFFSVLREAWPKAQDARRTKPEVRERMRDYVTEPRARTTQQTGFSAALLGADQGIEALEELAYSGRLTALIPQWREIDALAVADTNHLYTVDVHAFYTVAELAGFGSSTDPLVEAIHRDITHADWLLLGGLLHDIGKGRGRPHTAAGEAIAGDIAAGLGLDRHGRETISFLVGNHLLLSRVATRRDLNDRRVINGVAATAGDADRLKMLYLLTIADAKATGPKAWGVWRAALIRELFHKVLAALEGAAGLDADQQIRLEEKHFDLLGNTEETQVVLWSDAPGLSELAVVAPDRPGLFNRIAGALALSGLSVLAAQIYTTGDGRALEVFKVAAAFEPEVTTELFDRAQESIAKAISGRLALPYHVDELARRYKKPVKPGAPRVVVDNQASDKYTIIEVHAADEIGLLYKLTGALFELNLDIHLAKISTYGDEAVDVFYVLGLDGQKITDPDHLGEIEKNILFRVTA